MTFRRRLLAATMVTLAVGLGSLLVLGNVLLALRTRSEVSSILRANVQAQVSALTAGSTPVERVVLTRKRSPC